MDTVLKCAECGKSDIARMMYTEGWNCWCCACAPPRVYMLVEHKGPEDLHWEDIVETDDEDQHFCEYRVALRKVIGMTPLRCRGRSPGCYEYTNMVVCYHGSGLADAMCPACIGENGNKRIRKALEAGKAVIFCIRRSGSC